MKSRLAFLSYGLLIASTFGRAQPGQDPPLAVHWQLLETGLWLGEYTPAEKSIIGDSRITIVKVDPARFTFRLLESRRFRDRHRTALQWCREQKLLACINAGMYEPDGRSTGYMRDYQYLNNSTFSSGNCILAFNPADSLGAAIKLIDRGCEADWEQQLRHYHSCTQSIRLIDCAQRNTWALQPRQWSSAVWAVDADGQQLLIFCRSPYPMHTYAEILLHSPLGIRQAMYLEGGPEASLGVNSGATVREYFGSYETGFVENDASAAAFPLPNVLGVVRR